MPFFAIQHHVIHELLLPKLYDESVCYVKSSFGRPYDAILTKGEYDHWLALRRRLLFGILCVLTVELDSFQQRDGSLMTRWVVISEFSQRDTRCH
eukprot:1855368-Amphidinium_carterae.1